jgi:hypothetical protein
MTTGHSAAASSDRSRSAIRTSRTVGTAARLPPSGSNWIHEIKHDGYRLMARRDSGGIRLLTRRGHDWVTRFPLVADIDRLPLHFLNDEFDNLIHRHLLWDANSTDDTEMIDNAPVYITHPSAPGSFAHTRRYCDPDTSALAGAAASSAAMMMDDYGLFAVRNGELETWLTHLSPVGEKTD